MGYIFPNPFIKGKTNKFRSCARHELGFKKMKTQMIKKIAMSAAVAVVALVSSTESKAQYYLDYGPGSIAWDAQMQQRENAIRMQNAMMQQQILNYYQQQAAAATWHMQNTPFVPMQGVQTYNGPYINNGESYHTETVKCDHCDGGYNYREVYMGSGQSRTVKSRCNWCHGTGTINKKVKD